MRTWVFPDCKRCGRPVYGMSVRFREAGSAGNNVSDRASSKPSPLDPMSEMTYNPLVNADDKPLVWLHGEVKSPPFSREARLEAGYLLRRLQRGESLGLPHSRPMPAVGSRCHELRIVSADVNWRIVYRVDPDAVVILEVFSKKSRSTPRSVIGTCRRRIREYDNA